MCLMNTQFIVVFCCLVRLLHTYLTLYDIWYMKWSPQVKTTPNYEGYSKISGNLSKVDTLLCKLVDHTYNRELMAPL